MGKKQSGPAAWEPKGALFAVQELRGGTSKDGKRVPHVTPPGKRLDADEARKLGLDDSEILKLLSRGAIVERAVSDGGPASGAPAEFIGISRDDLHATLAGQGVALSPNADIEEMLGAALDHGAAGKDMVSLDELRAQLGAAGVEVADGSSVEAMVAAALAHGAPGDIDAEANRIEREVKAEDIKAELEKRQVPFETDANKPALAKLLAQVRAADPAKA